VHLWREAVYLPACGKIPWKVLTRLFLIFTDGSVHNRSIAKGQVLDVKQQLKTAAIGTAVGIVNGVFGAGGGTLLVPALENYMGLEAHKAHATAIAVILPLCAVSAAVYLWRVPADWTAVMWVSLGGMAGGVAGANLLNKLTSKWLHKLFAVFLAAAALRSIF
jgi:uncharacterized membrane protein YfcA